MFQSTRPRGARLNQVEYNYASGGFNPRARAGRDTEAAGFMSAADKFQSTRPRGARLFKDDRIG